MSKSVRLDVGRGRDLCCFEVEVDVQMPPQWIRLLISIPGRDGASRVVWSLGKYGIDEDQVADVAAVITSALTDGALMTCGGVQWRLPMA